MTISRMDSALLAKRVTELTPTESDCVTESVNEVDKLMRLYGLQPRGDDRSARLEAALIRYILESRE